MKIFQQREVQEAKAYAAAGGQALHLFDGAIADAIGRVKKIPNCFRGRKELGHLFDQDNARLQKTARRVGVRVVFVHHANTPSQHIDLCGKPLERAMFEAAGLPPVDFNPDSLVFLKGAKPPEEFKQQYMGELWTAPDSPRETP